MRDVIVKAEFVCPFSDDELVDGCEQKAGLVFRDWLSRCPDPKYFGLRFRQVTTVDPPTVLFNGVGDPVHNDVSNIRDAMESLRATSTLLVLLIEACNDSLHLIHDCTKAKAEPTSELFQVTFNPESTPS